MAEVEGRLARVRVCVAQRHQRAGYPAVQASALERIQPHIDGLAHDLVAEIQPFVRTFQQEATLQENLHALQGVLGGRGLQQIQAEIAADDRAELQHFERAGGQTVDALLDDLADALVVTHAQHTLILADPVFGQFRGPLALHGLVAFLEIAQGLAHEKRVALGGLVEKIGQLSPIMGVLVGELIHIGVDRGR